ncbi:radical SAM family heme chaperone HemW [Geobacter sp. AOG2]|uniref:radical SAM family heme chaperone HemW n=1 Tax=Geobacter sp. AOG2 TaxID=1566347 RepID=UPI001CC43EF6|nr:radical SAM family heme chaperone HemW [Geobacter sp. AOG2]GFE61722.1 coproporphyrinogen III oxidase [Geobacter sp. AOG2]
MFTRLYLHIPFCRRKCPYCAFVSQESASADLDGYAETLLAEMGLAAQAFRAERPLASVYFGGGTPSLLDPSHIARILERASDLFGLGQGAEITLEANPGTVDQKRLAAFRSAGVNRLSLGVQSFADPMLAALGRIHSAAEAGEAFRAARTAGFDNIGIDLIHALPGQTLPLWRTELEQALALGPEHLSVYGLTVEEGTPFAARYTDDSPLLPDEDLAAAMFEEADDLLTAAGYEHYEIANYALPGRRSDHNSGYWRRDGYLGLGCGAHSFLRRGYGVRFGNPADLEAYAGAIAQGRLPHGETQSLTRQDALAEFMFLGLRMADGIEEETFRQEFGVGLEETFGREVSKLAALGLLETDGGRIRLTRRGMLLSNQVFARFLP